MRVSLPVMLVVSMLCVAFVPRLSGAAEANGSSRVGAGVYAALSAQQKVRVLVALQDDAPKAAASERRASVAAAADAVLAALPAGSYTTRRRFDLVSAVALEVDAKSLPALAAHAKVRRIDLDVGGAGQLAQAKPLAHIMEVANSGKTGIGGKLAVIDSGIDLSHPDFANRIVGQQCFCSGGGGCCPNGGATMSGAGSAQDDFGHGTNVAGIAAAGGAVSMKGAAPDADLVVVKVLDANNEFCCTSDVVSALDWIRVNHPDTKVVNASLGTSVLFQGACDGQTSYTMAFADAVNNLVANGTMVVVSSGNQASPDSIAAPACVQAAIAVGAVWDEARPDTTFLGCSDTGIVPDKATCFTNSGPGLDLYAPGAFVTASGLGGGLSTFGGTSQAAPLVAGCIAVLRSAFPDAAPAEIEAALKASPTQITDPKNGNSVPRLDCAAAMLRLDGTLFVDSFD